MPAGGVTGWASSWWTRRWTMGRCWVWVAGAAAIIALGSGCGTGSDRSGSATPAVPATETAEVPTTSTAMPAESAPISTSPEAASTTVASSPTSTAIEPPAWMPIALAEAPLSQRVGMATAASNTHVIAWGGAPPEQIDGSGGYFTDGAVLDLTTGTWTSTAPSPLAAELATAVVHEGVFVVASRRPWSKLTDVPELTYVATYEPVSETWSDITPPGGSRIEQLATVGDEVIALPVALAWNGATWRPISPAPPWQFGARLATSSDALYALDIIFGDLPYQIGLVWRFDVATDSWAEFGQTTIEVGDGAALTVVGERLVVASYHSMEVGWFDLDTGVWTNGGRLPLNAGTCWMDAAPVAASIVIVEACGTVFAVHFDGQPPGVMRAPIPAFDGWWGGSKLLRSGDRTVIGLSNVVGDEFWSHPEAWGPFPLATLDIERGAVRSSSGVATPIVDHIDHGDAVVVELTMGCTVATVPDAEEPAPPLDEALPVEDGSTGVRFMTPGAGWVYELSCADRTADAFATAASVITTHDRKRVWPSGPIPGQP